MTSQLQAYLDESFSEDEFILAGYISTTDNWAMFSEEWQRMLPDQGIELSDGTFHFKMNEMVYPNRVGRVRQFYNVIEKYDLTPVSCRLNSDDFGRARQRLFDLSDHLGWRLRELGTHLENRYRFLFYTMMMSLNQQRDHINLGAEGPIDFIFDERREQKSILAAWDDFLANRQDDVREKYGERPRFEDDRHCLPLQAADFWAWWVRKWYEEDNSEIPDEMRRLEFGGWRGKSSNIVVVPISEDAIFDTMREFCVRSLIKHRENWDG